MYEAQTQETFDRARRELREAGHNLWLAGLGAVSEVEEGRREWHQVFDRLHQEAEKYGESFLEAIRVDDVHLLGCDVARRATHRLQRNRHRGIAGLPVAMQVAFEPVAIGRVAKFLARHVDGLIDALELRDVRLPQRAIIKGDSISYSIAAASILAKVHRDEMMERYDSEFPDYGFSSHMGYGTRQHYEALSRLGPCPLHRRSFRGVCEEEAVQGPASLF